ncbi:MAG: hypothetical protein H6663_06480 [Candidatus Promineofilum sp.]|nr:hypothetical protein [Promineifilum sp.]
MHRRGLCILVTNDDGVTSPGLLALAQAMAEFSEVSVLAPDHDWSGGGMLRHCAGRCVCAR